MGRKWKNISQLFFKERETGEFNMWKEEPNLNCYMVEKESGSTFFLHEQDARESYYKSLTFSRGAGETTNIGLLEILIPVNERKTFSELSDLKEKYKQSPHRKMETVRLIQGRVAGLKVTDLHFIQKADLSLTATYKVGDKSCDDMACIYCENDVYNVGFDFDDEQRATSFATVDRDSVKIASWELAGNLNMEPDEMETYINTHISHEKSNATQLPLPLSDTTRQEFIRSLRDKYPCSLKLYTNISAQDYDLSLSQGIIPPGNSQNCLEGTVGKYSLYPLDKDNDLVLEITIPIDSYHRLIPKTNTDSDSLILKTDGRLELTGVKIFPFLAKDLRRGEEMATRLDELTRSLKHIRSYVKENTLRTSELIYSLRQEIYSMNDEQAEDVGMLCYWKDTILGHEKLEDFVESNEDGFATFRYPMPFATWLDNLGMKLSTYPRNHFLIDVLTRYSQIIKCESIGIEYKGEDTAPALNQEYKNLIDKVRPYITDISWNTLSDAVTSSLSPKDMMDLEIYESLHRDHTLSFNLTDACRQDLGIDKIFSEADYPGDGSVDKNIICMMADRLYPDDRSKLKAYNEVNNSGKFVLFDSSFYERNNLGMPDELPHEDDSSSVPGSLSRSHNNGEWIKVTDLNEYQRVISHLYDEKLIDDSFFGNTPDIQDYCTKKVRDLISSDPFPVLVNSCDGYMTSIVDGIEYTEIKDFPFSRFVTVSSHDELASIMSESGKADVNNDNYPVLVNPIIREIRDVAESQRLVPLTYDQYESRVRDKEALDEKFEDGCFKGSGFEGRLYHGSSFNLTQFHDSPSGIYFFDDKMEAQRYGVKGRVYECRAYLENPLIVDMNGETDLRLSSLVKDAKEKGCDSLIAYDVFDGESRANQYVIFSREKIRITGKSDYYEDLREMMPKVTSLENINRQPVNRQITFEISLLNDDGADKIRIAVNEKGVIRHARNSDEKDYALFKGLDVDSCFGFGTFKRLKELDNDSSLPVNPGYLPFTDELCILCKDEGQLREMMNWKKSHLLSYSNDTPESYPVLVNIKAANFLSPEDMVETMQEAFTYDDFEKVRNYSWLPEIEKKSIVPIPGKWNQISFSLTNPVYVMTPDAEIRECFTQALLNERGSVTLSRRGQSATFDLVNLDPSVISEIGNSLKAVNLALELDSLCREYLPSGEEGVINAFYEEDYRVCPRTVNRAEYFLRNMDILGNDMRIASIVTELRHLSGMDWVDMADFPQLTSREWEDMTDAINDVVEKRDEVRELPEIVKENFPKLKEYYNAATGNDDVARGKLISYFMHISDVGMAKENSKYDFEDTTIYGTIHTGQGAKSFFEFVKKQSEIIPENYCSGLFSVGNCYTSYRIHEGRVESRDTNDYVLAQAYARTYITDEQFSRLSSDIDTLKKGINLCQLHCECQTDKGTLDLEFTDQRGVRVGSMRIKSEDLQYVSNLMDDVHNNMHSLYNAHSGNVPSNGSVFPSNYMVEVRGDEELKLLQGYQVNRGLQPSMGMDRFPCTLPINGVFEGGKEITVDFSEFSFMAGVPEYNVSHTQSIVDCFRNLAQKEGLVRFDLPSMRIYESSGVFSINQLSFHSLQRPTFLSKDKVVCDDISKVNPRLLLDSLQKYEQELGYYDREYNHLMENGMHVGGVLYKPMRCMDGKMYLSLSGKPIGKGIDIISNKGSLKSALYAASNIKGEIQGDDEIQRLMSDNRLSSVMFRHPVDFGRDHIVGLTLDMMQYEDKYFVPFVECIVRSSSGSYYNIALSELNDMIFNDVILESADSIREAGEFSFGRDAMTMESDMASILNSQLVSSMKEHNIDKMSFSKPQKMELAGKTYSFDSFSLFRTDKCIEVGFEVSTDNETRFLPLSVLPSQVAVRMFNESKDSINTQLLTLSELTARGGEVYVCSSDVSNYSSKLLAQQSIADRMNYYGIEHINFDIPLVIGQLKVTDVMLNDERVILNMLDMDGKPYTEELAEQTPEEIKVIADRLNESFHTPQISNARESGREKSLIGKLEAMESVCEVEYQGKRAGIKKEGDHLILLTENETVRHPFLSLEDDERDKVELAINYMVSSRKSSVEGILFEDDRYRLTFSGSQFLLSSPDGEMQLDVSRACNELRNSDVDILQQDRESLYSFCRRHVTSFKTDTGNIINCTLKRSNEDYVLKVIDDENSLLQMSSMGNER